MNSLAGIQLLCFKNKYMEVFFLCQSFLYWSVKVLKEKWWQWGNRAAVWAASYLLTPSRGGGAPQHPHKSLVRGKTRGQEMTKRRMRSKRFPRSGVNVHTCSWRKLAKSHSSPSSYLFRELVYGQQQWHCHLSFTRSQVMLICHKTQKKWAG